MAGEFIGKVESIQGVVQVRAANGELRPLLLGDWLHDGDVVITGDGGKLVIRVADGGLVYADPGQSVAMTGELPLSRFAGAYEPEAPAVDPLVQAVLGGGDLDAMMEGTAAGPAGAGSDGGHGFVQLLRVSEFASAPLGLTTTGLIANPLLAEQTLPLTDERAIGNDVPVGAALEAQTHFDGDMLGGTDGSSSFAAVDLSGAFVDPDGDMLTYTATGLPPGLTIDPVTGVISGTIEASASDATDDDNNQQVYSVTVTATDTSAVPSNPVAFNWTVNNSIPEFLSGADSAETAPNVDAYRFGANQNDGAGTLVGRVTSADADNDTPAYRITEGNDAGLFAIDALTGAITLTQTLDNAHLGNFQLTVQVRDQEGGRDVASVRIIARGTDDNALVVGSNASDTDAQVQPMAHVVDTSPFGPEGAVDGGTSDDILIGDVGGSGLQAGQIGNVVFVLDTSGSMSSEIQFTDADGNTSAVTRLEALMLSTKDALSELANSGAVDVRVHIVQFGTSARTLGTFDVMDPDQLQAAFAALDAPPADTGFTNYEAGLALAQRWIEGSSFVTPVDRAELAIVDANRDEGGSHNDRAYVLGNAGTPLALVSGWGATTADLRDAGGGGILGFGVQGGASDTQLDAGEVLRFDFGAFNDFDGVGPYNNAGSFNSALKILAASFELRDNGDTGAGTQANTDFAYTITFADGTREEGTTSAHGMTAITLQGTSTNAGREIAHIAFSVLGSEVGEQAQVSLLSVTQTAVSGALTNADINRVVFVSDSEPNYALNDSGLAVAVDDQTAIDHVLGIADTSNEVGAIENSTNTLGQAFTIESIGINISSLAPDADPIQLPVTNELSQLESSGGSATDIVTANDLAEVLGQIAGATQSPSPVGNDVINGRAGNDLIFGDAPFTDTLAGSQGLSLFDGAGWNVFAALEAGAGIDAAWSRSDTLNYLANHHLELSAESGRAGGNDRIDAGGGDDIVYGQEGDDLIIGGAGNDSLIGGGGSDAFVFRLADVGTGRGASSALDTIADFTLGMGGDVLDLRDLLQGEESALSAINLSAYLSFVSDGSGTTLDVSRNGDGVVDQRIQFLGVDLTAGNTFSDAGIIQTLLGGNQLLKD